MKTACALFVASCNGTLRPLEIRYRVGKPTVIHCIVMTRRHPVSWQPVMAAPLAPSARTVAAVPVGSVSSCSFLHSPVGSTFSIQYVPRSHHKPRIVSGEAGCCFLPCFLACAASFDTHTPRNHLLYLSFSGTSRFPSRCATLFDARCVIC